MIIILRLTPTLRRKLKNPLGKLIKGSYKKTMDELKQIIDERGTSQIIAVGDIVSKNMIMNKIFPKVFIVDNKALRKPITPIQIKVEDIIHVNNPAGTITKEACEGIQRALKKQKNLIKVLVNGEEDLLTLVSIKYAQENALVIYGQPFEGIVVVTVTNEKKNEIKKILEAMLKLKSE